MGRLSRAFFFFSSRRRHTRSDRDWSSDVCSSDLDDPILPGKNAYGDPNIEHKYTDNLPEVHDVLRELRQLVDSYPGGPVLISEADEPNIAELAKMYGAHDDEVQLPMDFQIADVNKLSAADF